MASSRRQGGDALGSWLSWAAITATYVALRLNVVDVPLDRDEGTFGLIGRTILEGGVPYRDAIDHKPPLVFFLYSLALLVFPPTARGLHVFLHLYNFATLVVLYFVARRLFGVAAGRWTAFVFAVVSSGSAVQGFTLSTEMLLLLPLSASLLLALGCADGETSAASLAASGACAALACWIKQPAVLLALFVLGTAALLLHARGVSRLVAGLGAWAAGGLAVCAAVIGYFAANGVLGEFLYWCFVHGALYSTEQSYLDHLSRTGAHLWEVVKGSPAVLAAAVLFPLCLRRRALPGPTIAAAFLVVALAMIPLGFVYRHYFAVLCPPIALVCGAGLAEATGRIAGVGARWATAACLGLVLAAGQVVADPGYYVSDSREDISHELFAGNPFVLAEEIAHFLAEDGSPDDRVLIFGSEPEILLLSGLESATAFTVVYPLMREVYPRHREFQERLMQETATEPPDYILFVDIQMSLLWDGKATLEARSTLQDVAARDYEPLRTWLREPGMAQWAGVEGPLTGRARGTRVIRLFRRRSG